MKENLLKRLPYLKYVRSKYKNNIIDEFNNCIVIEINLEDDRFERRFKSIRHVSCKIKNKIHMFFPLSKKYNKYEYPILYKKIRNYYKLSSLKQSYHIEINKLTSDLTVFINESEKLIDSSLKLNCKTSLDYKREFSNLIKKETKFIKWVIKILEDDIPTKFHRNDREIFKEILNLYKENKTMIISGIIRKELLSIFKIDRSNWEDEVIQEKIGEFILDINILFITKNIDEIKRKYGI